MFRADVEYAIYSSLSVGRLDKIEYNYHKCLWS